MFFTSRGFQTGLALFAGILVLLLPLPEGTTFRINGDSQRILPQHTSAQFSLMPGDTSPESSYQVRLNPSSRLGSPGKFLLEKVKELKLTGIQIDFIDGLSPKGRRFMAVLAVLIILFVAEPIPLEITAICIGVFLVIMDISDVKQAWAPYMHPVVVFIMCCLIFALALDKVGLTRRLGNFIIHKAGTGVIRFTFTIAIALGISSSMIHDAAACAVGIITILPLMKASGIEPHSNTAKFMMISIPFACSCGGMGTLIGGGRCMVAAAFLKEFTGIEIDFIDWILYAMPLALITVPASVAVVYLIFRPDPACHLPDVTEEDFMPWSITEKKALGIILTTLILWVTKPYHGIHYSATGMLGVSALVLAGILKWEDIHTNLEWGTVLFIFGGGISLGLAMDYSGAARYLSNLFFPYIHGGGWFLLLCGISIFGALVTNLMANVAAAALILPIVIPIAQLEGINPALTALCLGTSTSFAMLLVIGCPPNAIAYSYRYFKASDLTRAGLGVTPVLLAILILAASAWWSLLGLV